ncbi:MAG TPA: class I SAM-dependent methyltransferase [Thermoanaerobaculia bacterium]|jgi:SAM-dependent methyltransferase
MSSEPHFDPGGSEVVASYVRRLAGAGGAPCVLIHPADEMFLYNRHSLRGSDDAAAILYFLKGHQILRAVEDIVRWRFGGFSGVGSLLDFASGFGRSTRFLVRALAPERIAVAEIDPRAVHFQAASFGVAGIVSTRDPETLRLQGPFDVVVASSFFSHLPADRFAAWLARLYGELAPGGVLLFSVHGAALLSEPDVDWSAGIVFRASSETARLNPSEYGTSYVTEDFVRAATERAAGAGARLEAVPFGFCAYQDLYVLVRPPVPDLPPLDVSRFPRGELDRSAIRDDGAVPIEGWAEGAPDEPPPAVSLWLRDTPSGVLTGEGAPGSRRRWSFSFPAAAVSPDDVVRVEAESSRGLSNILSMGTLRPFLPGVAAGRRSDERVKHRV